jgi:hypothetical protein
MLWRRLATVVGGSGIIVRRWKSILNQKGAKNEGVPPCVGFFNDIMDRQRRTLSPMQEMLWYFFGWKHPNK